MTTHVCSDTNAVLLIIMTLEPQGDVSMSLDFKSYLTFTEPDCTPLVLHSLSLKLSHLWSSSCPCQQTSIHRSSNIRYLRYGLSDRWPVITEEDIHMTSIQYSTCFHCVLIKLIKAKEYFWLFSQERLQSFSGGGSISTNLSFSDRSDLALFTEPMLNAAQSVLRAIRSLVKSVNFRSQRNISVTKNN